MPKVSENPEQDKKDLSNCLFRFKGFYNIYKQYLYDKDNKRINPIDIVPIQLQLRELEICINNGFYTYFYDYNFFLSHKLEFMINRSARLIKYASRETFNVFIIDEENNRAFDALFISFLYRFKGYYSQKEWDLNIDLLHSHIESLKLLNELMILKPGKDPYNTLTANFYK